MTTPPPGSRLECAGLLARLVLDLALNPVHLVVFLVTRGRHRRRLARSLAQSALSLQDAP